MQAGLKNLDNSPFSDRLFDLLDSNGDDAVDLCEFVSGLSIVCKGTVEEKILLSFKAIDVDGNGYIDEACITHSTQPLSYLNIAGGNGHTSQGGVAHWLQNTLCEPSTNGLPN